MANYLDGMEGGKHNSDNIEVSEYKTTYEVKLVFTDIDAKDPKKAVEKVLEWIKDGVDDMVFDVRNEITHEEFTVDLSEEEENQVLPNENNPELIKKNLIADIQKIIGEFGSFTTAEIEADCDVSIPTIGNHIHLAYGFNYSEANVDVYENGDENEIDSYHLPYYDMDIDTLEDVLVYTQIWEAMCLQDEDRQGVNQ